MIAARLVLLTLSIASAVSAQELRWPGPSSAPTESDVAQGEALYQAGRLEVDARRFDRALESFQRAYRASGSPEALLGLGITLRALSRHYDAVTAFEQLLRVHGEELAPERRAGAESLLSESRAELGRVVLHGLSPEEVDLRVDDVSVPSSPERPLAIERDPGPLRLEVVQGAGRFFWSGELSRGQSLRLDVLFARPASADPWIALGVGAGAAALVAIVVAISIAAYTPAPLEPRSGVVVRL